MGAIADRLAAAGITLPDAPAAAAAYVPWQRSGDLVFTAGQIPVAAGVPTHLGRLGDGIDVAAGQAAARQCAINVLAQLRAAAGELEAVESIVKITVFVASTPEFDEQHLVANGASLLLAEILGPDVGSHARSAVGVAALPMGVPVEVEAIARLR